MCKTVFLHFWLWVSHYQTVVRIPTACPHPLICNVKQNIWVPQRFWKISKIVTSWTHSHGLSSKTSFWWESVNFYVLFSYFFLVKMAQKMKKHCRADLQLCTIWPSPPIIEEKLAVAFLAKTPNKVLAEAGTCSKVLKIPRYHTEYNDNFFKYMDLSISYGKVGFGKI